MNSKCWIILWLKCRNTNRKHYPPREWTSYLMFSLLIFSYYPQWKQCGKARPDSICTTLTWKSLISNYWLSFKNLNNMRMQQCLRGLLPITNVDPGSFTTHYVVWLHTPLWIPCQPVCKKKKKKIMVSSSGCSRPVLFPLTWQCVLKFPSRIDYFQVMKDDMHCSCSLKKNTLKTG
jgi:hypothetical protein